MPDKLIILCTNAKNDAEKANLAFVIATTAQAADTDVRVFLATDGIYLATKGYVEDIHVAGHPPLKEIMELYISQGGTIFICTPCASRRNVVEEDLIDGAKLVGVSELAMFSTAATCISL